MNPFYVAWKSLGWLTTLVILTSCASTVPAKCSGRLSPINAPSPVHSQHESGAATSSGMAQELQR